MGNGPASATGRIVKTYGRGGLLGALSPILAALMASAGMRGWQASAIRRMEDEGVSMARRGYRIAETRELGWPQLGIVYYRVTYEPVPPAASAAGAD